MAAQIPPECGDWPVKPAWQWTDSERLDRRFDERCLAARRALAADESPDDWNERIEKAAADFIESLRARQKTFSTTYSATPAERRKIDADVTESQRADCALRTAALNATRAAFEPQLFDRLLYVAVAPGLCTSGTGERATREWIARGCPEKW